MSEIMKRLRAMVAEENMGLDSTSKSLRGYTTFPHELLKERLRQHFPEYGPKLSHEGRTFRYETDAEGLTGSRMLNLALQSFYDQEADPGKELILFYPKTSKKTLTGPESDYDTMRSDIEAWVSDHSSLSRGITSFRDLVQSELGPHTTSDLLDNFKGSKLTAGILQFLHMHGWSFPADKHVVVEGRPTPIGGLTMKTKYYISRDDNRAYCQDRNRLRLLSGACLQRLVYPKSYSIRRGLDLSQVLRAKDKDELHLVVPRAREGQSTLLIVGDISNFTGSFANSWLLLHAITLELAGNLRDKFSVFSVGDCFIWAPWHELIAVYLYLTVGAEVYVEDLDRYEYLPGGYLGVTANIAVGLWCLSLFMTDLTRRLLKMVFSIQSQAGGDDFAFLLVVDDREKENIVMYIKNDMQNHVGQLKELSVTEVDHMEEGVIEDRTFCRKRITLTRSNSHTVLGSEPSCPLAESILPYSAVRRKDEQVLEWNHLDAGLLEYERKCPHMRAVTDALREVFLRKYPEVKPVRTTSTKRFWPVKGLSGCPRHGYLFSDKAWEAVQNLDRIDIGPFYLLVSLDQKIRHLQVREIIQSFDRVLYRGDSVTAYILKDEIGLLETERAEEAVSLQFEDRVLDQFLTIVA